ncbi:MAG: hypothetical protein JO271_00060, partial [Verrucomicrobia bacterium]|nr:hypothetical protein [Verrucomicrobiota bacterium]
MARSVRVVGKIGNLTIGMVGRTWGPLPLNWGADTPLTEDEEAQILARRALAATPNII